MTNKGITLMKIIIVLFFTLLFVFIFLDIIPNRSFATTTQNDNYLFRFKINYFQNPFPNSNYKAIIPDLHATDVPSHPLTPSTIPSPVLKATPTTIIPANSIEIGYPDNIITTPYSFTISDILIDYGLLAPTNPIIRSNELSILSLSLLSLDITGTENHPLSTDNGSIIPNATCDNGSCTDMQASSWNSTLTYGFGYRCDNINNKNCIEDFSDASSFKQFSEESNHSTAKSIIKTYGHTNISSKITYKINIPGTQQKGLYRNTITYIAIPSF